MSTQDTITAQETPAPVTFTAAFNRPLRYDPVEGVLVNYAALTVTVSDGRTWPYTIADFGKDGHIETDKIRLRWPDQEAEAEMDGEEPAQPAPELPPLPLLPESPLEQSRIIAAIRAELGRVLAAWEVEVMPDLPTLPAGEPRNYRIGDIITTTRDVWVVGNRASGYAPDLTHGERLKVVGYYRADYEEEANRPFPKSYEIDPKRDGLVVEVKEQGGFTMTLAFDILCPMPDSMKGKGGKAKK